MSQTKKNNAHVMDMTTGSPLKLILAFAIPLFIGNIFQQIYTIVDTTIVGHFVGDNAIGAIGATSSVFALTMNIAISMANGFAIIVTQAFGAHDKEKIRRSIAGTFILSIIIIAVLTTLALSLLHPLLHLLNTPAEIYDDAYKYIFILFAGLFATVGYNIFSGIIRAFGNSRTPLYYLIVSSIVNVILDYLFVAVFPWGVVGAALATLLSQLLSALLCAFSVFKNYKDMLPHKEDYKASVPMWGLLLKTGFSMALMMCVVNLGSVVFQRANNDLGPAIIAAYAAAHKVINAIMQPLGTIATAASTFVSQNWGAKKLDRIRTTLKKLMGLEILWGVIACAIIYATGRFFMQLVTGSSNEEILSNGVLCMRFSLPAFAPLGVLLCLRLSMQAMGYTFAPVASSCIELLVKALGAIYLIPAYGYLGSVITEPLTWVSMTIFLLIIYAFQRKKIFNLK